MFFGFLCGFVSGLVACVILMGAWVHGDDDE
jgi:hypothetical protein